MIKTLGVLIIDTTSNKEATLLTQQKYSWLVRQNCPSLSSSAALSWLRLNVRCTLALEEFSLPSFVSLTFNFA